MQCSGLLGALHHAAPEEHFIVTPVSLELFMAPPRSSWSPSPCYLTHLGALRCAAQVVFETFTTLPQRRPSLRHPRGAHHCGMYSLVCIVFYFLLCCILYCVAVLYCIVRNILYVLYLMYPFVSCVLHLWYCIICIIVLMYVIYRMCCISCVVLIVFLYCILWYVLYGFFSFHVLHFMYCILFCTVVYVVCCL